LTLYVFTLNQSDSKRKYAATICKNCIYLTRFLSEIGRLVYFQFQIQHESSIEDLNSGYSPVCELRVPGQPILNSALRLSSNRSDGSMILQRQNEIPEKQCNQFRFRSCKTTTQSAQYFSISSVTHTKAGSRKPVRESPLLSMSLLRLTESFWVSRLL